MEQKQCLVKKYLYKVKVNILMLGLQGAGKSELIQKMVKKGHDRVGYQSSRWSPDFQIETVEIDKVKIVSWDLLKAYSKLEQTVRSKYFDNIQILIFVVDSNNQENMDLARQQLHKLLSDERLKDIFVIILANKSDQNKMSLQEFRKRLEIDPSLNFPTQNFIHLQSNIYDQSIINTFFWIQRGIQKKK